MGDDFFVVLALGDSLTAGYRTRDLYAMDPRIPYPAQLEALLRKKIGTEKQVFVINAGVNGDFIEGMLRRFRHVVELEKPDFCVVWGGIPDISAGRRTENIMENLATLYSLCVEFSATPVACTLTPTRYTSPAMRCLNNQIKSHASKKDIILTDLFPPLADEEGNLRQEYNDDDVHLPPLGYRCVAEKVFDSIASQL